MSNSVHCGFYWLSLMVACMFPNVVIILIVILCSVGLYLFQTPVKLIECPSTKDQLLSARCPSMLPTWGHFKLILQLKFPRPGRCINFKSYTCVREDCVLTSHGLGLDRHFSSLQIGRLFFFFLFYSFIQYVSLCGSHFYEEFSIPALHLLRELRLVLCLP